MTMTTLFIVALVAAVQANSGVQKPNIVYFLTDDQDQMLGGSFPPVLGVTPMPKTDALLASAGSTATNFFIHTPICCPSRGELLSGRYFHNIKQTHGGCMHVNETTVNDATFARYLKEQGGYTVGMFGKYLNTVPNYVPTGFDAWLANGGGDYIAPEFSTKNIHGLPDGHWRGSAVNYTTAVVGNTSNEWIRRVVTSNPSQPFFAYIAPKACHEPFNPAPWYADHWDRSWPPHEIRPVNWNCSAESRSDHHGNIAEEPMITAAGSAVITGIFRNRWRTLMSVDDVIADTVALTKALGVFERTYFLYSSDHGFQLGEFNILMDKRQVYDWNTRIHLLASGPGIKAGSHWNAPATQVDLAPTFLGLAGVTQPAQMDGRSLVPFLVDPSDPAVLPSTRAHLASLPNRQRYSATWRSSVFIEYYFNADNDKCAAGPPGHNDKCEVGNYPQSDTYCADLDDGTACWGPAPGHDCTHNCYRTEDLRNNFIAVRTMPWSPYGALLYSEFQTGDQARANINFDNLTFHEMYDCKADEWQMNNVYTEKLHSDPGLVQRLHVDVHRWFTCTGSSCP